MEPLKEPLKDRFKKVKWIYVGWTLNGAAALELERELSQQILEPQKPQIPQRSRSTSPDLVESPLEGSV